MNDSESLAFAILIRQAKRSSIRGRMPSSRLVGKHQRPIQGFEAFTNRAWRWREAFGIADWNVRGGSSGRLRSGGENEEVDAVAAEEAAKALREESERARETQLYDILVGRINDPTSGSLPAC